MRRKSNVNPDHYKLAGRDRPGEGILQDAHRRRLGQETARTTRRGGGMAEKTRGKRTRTRRP